jgi:hypothetical protein
LPRSETSLEDQLQRQININLQLRRQLETARRDVVEYCAKFCEDHLAEYKSDGIVLVPVKYSWMGRGFAEGLRGIIGG